MATGNVYVTVVDIGQGQCTFVEIYNDASPAKLIHALLLDCGSDKRSDEVYTNLDYIAAKVLTLDTPGFDCIFFSHSDKDHISLTKYVLDKIWETKKPVVKRVVYGGAWKKYTKDTRNPFNILDYIVKNSICPKTSIFTMYSNSTDYDKTTGAYVANLWASTDGSVIVRKIAGNVLSDDPDWEEEEDLDEGGKTAEELNRVSLIAGLYYAGVSCVICGDATNVTMSAVDQLFSAGTTVFNKNLMTTLPHHGSRATGFAVPRTQKASDSAIKIVDDFSATMKSFTLSVSAFARHSHPSLQLMNRFMPTIVKPVIRDARLVQNNAHYITANVDIVLEVDALAVGKKRPLSWTVPQKSDASFESNTNTFSTRYYTGGKTFSYNLSDLGASDSLGQTAAINPFACWRYRIAADGNAYIGGYQSLATPLASFTSAPLPQAGIAIALREELLILPDGAAPERIQVQPEQVRIKTKMQQARPAVQKLSPLYHLKQFH